MTVSSDVTATVTKLGAKAPALVCEPYICSSSSGDTTLRFSLIRLSVAMVAIWCVAIWLYHRGLETYTESQSLLSAMRSMRAPSPNPIRFLIFQGFANKSQGAGNIVAGLLAAHLLALEFGRVVCVPAAWTDFTVAFRQREYVQECAELQVGGKKYPKVRSWNFGKTDDECRIRDMLASEARVLVFDGNTYPKWTRVPRDFFDLHYEPTEALLTTLPWKGGPPQVVVHLRKPDSIKDRRKGLDDATLEALGKALPRSTFLVTNHVAWYDYFLERFGWSNSGWDQVTHTVVNIGKKTDWGKREDAAEDKTRDRQMLELWSDWYTILRAEEVYHTASDFSQSAIHWMGIESKIIMGMTDGGELNLIDEPWRRDGEMAPLVDRTLEELGTELVPCYKGAKGALPVAGPNQAAQQMKERLALRRRAQWGKKNMSRHQ